MLNNSNSMGTNILEERMLEDSLAVFRNNEHETVTPAQGVMLIDGWLQALQGDPNLDPMRGQMIELRDELQATTPNSQRIKLLMNELAGHAQQTAEAPTSEGTWTGGMESFSKLLRSFASNL